jgi:hypothetical protein
MALRTHTPRVRLNVATPSSIGATSVRSRNHSCRGSYRASTSSQVGISSLWAHDSSIGGLASEPCALPVAHARCSAPTPPRRRALRTVEDLQRVIQHWYGVNYQSRTSCLTLFARCGFGYQQPARVFKSWREADATAFDELIERSRRRRSGGPDTVILAEDEVSLYLTATVAQVWAPVHRPPSSEPTHSEPIPASMACWTCTAAA